MLPLKWLIKKQIITQPCSSFNIWFNVNLFSTGSKSSGSLVDTIKLTGTKIIDVLTALCFTLGYIAKDYNAMRCLCKSCARLFESFV